MRPKPRIGRRQRFSVSKKFVEVPLVQVDASQVIMSLESIAGTINRELAIGLVDRNRRLLEHASQHVYKIFPISEVDQGELAIHIFVPPGWAAGDM